MKLALIIPLLFTLSYCSINHNKKDDKKDKYEVVKIAEPSNIVGLLTIPIVLLYLNKRNKNITNS
jgi:hypothetical protein